MRKEVKTLLELFFLKSEDYGIDFESIYLNYFYLKE